MRRYTVAIDGQAFVVDVEDTGAEHFVVSVAGQAFDVALLGHDELSTTEIRPQIAIAPKAALRAPRVTPTALASGATLEAPMPGLILRVSVAAGATVQRGQDIAVLEAMKMENILRAPCAGVIQEVCVSAGQQVGHGSVIVRLAEDRS